LPLNRHRASPQAEARELDFITVLGKVEPVRIYEVMGLAGTLSATQEELRRSFAQGLIAYRDRAWDRAEQEFAQCLAVVPGDKPATVFRERIALLRLEALPVDWDGVWHLSEK
jgi:adenylate cyclase